MSQVIPVAVVGCGRMGRLHARVFSQMPSVRLAGVLDADVDAADDVAMQHGAARLDSLDAVASVARAVVIATPTTTHLAVATPLLQRGIACFIEKPLAGSSDEARQLVELAEKHGAVLQVGHIERFNPAVRAMQRLNIRPGFVEVTRISPLTFRSIDVGVVLDVMIHDIDIVLNLVRSEVVDVQSAGVSVIGGGSETRPAEDVCNARLRFANGCVANLTASRLALKVERRLRVFSDDAYVSLDYQKKYGIVVKRSGNLEALRNVVARLRRGEIEDLSQLDYRQIVQVEELTIDDAEPARAQLDAFVAAIKGESPVPVTGSDGLAAVELAERIVAAIPDKAL
jgi:predicted dehydrogenase